MKQSLQLRMGQQLTMTPQLQQAIKLLQLSTLDLQQEIQQALESNMMLEVAEEENIKSEGDSATESPKIDNSDDISSAGSQTEMPNELPIDSSWEDVYEGALATSSALSQSEMPDFETQHSKSESLKEHLLWQLDLSLMSEKDRAIASAIIDSLNEDGYLSHGLEDIYAGLLEQLEDLDFDEIEAVLHSVQNFDPIGIAAVDLADCLRLQLQT